MDTPKLQWEEALDLLEADLRLVEELADTGVPVQLTAWTPPSLRGQLPEELRERALNLHQRQLQVRERLAGLAARTGRELDVARTVSGGLRYRGLSTTRPALYIDTTA